jgi:glycosyltransferase involved in cell wall biosynthesis
MAARILPWKGWDKVLKVAHSLSKKNINFKLLLAGSDDEGYLSTIKKLISDYHLSDIVDIRNHYENIDNFFEELDLFLFLSSSEGFGLVVLEAIENNVTVICSDISPLNEFVKGTEGSLVNRENTEHIAELIEKYASDNKFLLKKVQREQKQFVIDNFSIEISADKIEKFYINTINV